MQVGPPSTNQGQRKDGCSTHNEGWIGNLAEQFVFFLGAILFCFCFGSAFGRQGSPSLSLTEMGTGMF